MTIYIQTDQEGLITDAITYPHGDYIPVETPAPLPVGLIGGAYELLGGNIIYRREWDKNQDFEDLRAEVEQLKSKVEELEGKGEKYNSPVSPLSPLSPSK